MILSVENLTVNFKTKKGELGAVRGVNFHVKEGEILGVVGESGSGKSVTMKSIIKILPENGYLRDGRVEFLKKDITNLPVKEFKKIQGRDMSMIFQDPMTALNPLKTIGYHIEEILKRHTNLTKKEIRKKAMDLLLEVEIPDPEKRFFSYPHELSGGQRQRVVIAMALSTTPKLLIGDEPTTALDVTIQKQILKLIKKLQIKENMSVILITHDLSVVYSICDRVVVMYGGKVMESGGLEDIFYNSKHPYTKALLNSMPDIESSKKELKPIEGMAPSLETMPKGCPFAPRCEYTTEVCLKDIPKETNLGGEHITSCFNYKEIDDGR